MNTPKGYGATHTPRKAGLLGFLVATMMILAFLYWFSQPSTTALIQQTRHALKRSDAAKAVAETQQLVLMQPNSSECWQLRVQAGLLAEDREIWTAAMSELERVDLQSAREWWLKIGSEEMKKFRGASAEQALRKAIAISADDAESWRLLAQLISIQGRPGETAECLMSLIRLDAFTSGDLLTLAWPNSAIHDLERVEKLLQAEPENRVPMLAYVGTALNENRLADAEAILKEIIQHHPENLRATALLGILLAERDAPEFLQWRNHIPAGSILEPETWIAMGTWLRTHNQISASARCFRKSVELDPRHLNALQELGQTMRMLGEPDISAQILEHARLQQEITELARRIEEQGNFQPARMIISHLEQAGRIREAWAWCKVYNNEQRETPIEQSTVERLSNRLSSSLPRTAPDFIPGGNYDWSELAEPDWTMSGLSQEPLPAIAQEESTLSFEDKAVALGVRFHFENGPEKGGTIVQTSGGGVAAIDYDRDGWCDLHFTQGGSSLSEAKQSETDSIYRNWHGKVFREVSSAAGISEDRFSQGVSAGDFNNDGFADLYVANLGQNRLLKNNGDGTFIDVSEEAGIRSTGWTTSCAIADLNGDGNADLFNVRYASGADITTRVCRDTDGRPGICRPTLFPAESDLVAISSADGTFTELCDEVGVNLPDGRGFGLVVADFNGDSRLDVFVANDQTANFLLIQDQSESGQLNYKEEAIFHGVASDRDGYPQACMGIAAGDVNDDGRTDLFVTNFANESNTLYESQLHGGFQDTTREAKLRDPGFQMLGFGTQFLDADLDGRLDLVVLNGHILDSPETGRPAAMRPQFFRGLANRRFAERTGIPRDDFFYHPRIGRGLCVLDWNRDGRPDFAASLLDGNGAVVKNTTATPGNWLSLELVGVHSSRDAIGVSIVATAADGTARYWQQTAGDGFAASNERRLLLGLGRALEVARLELQWPSGKVQEFQNVKGNACWTVVEGRPALYRAIAADQ